MGSFSIGTMNDSLGYVLRMLSDCNAASPDSSVGESLIMGAELRRT